MATRKKVRPNQPSASGATVNLLLQYSGGLNFKKAMVNDVQMVFNGGVARFSITAGGDHRLQWEVAGFVGAKWSYKLVSETDGYVIRPKTLSDPGRSFTLEQAFKRPKLVTFSLEKVEVES